MKKEKGFTLIELLSVIVILAIIALIAVPTIVNISNKAKASAFKDTAYAIINAADLYFAEQQLNTEELEEDTIFNLPEDANKTDGLQIKGKIPTGTVKITPDGEVSIAVKKGKYCATKRYKDADIKFMEEFTECNIPPAPLEDLATTNTELGVTSIAACLNDGTNCEPGTAFAIKVNDTDTYKFRVLKDEGGILTLIMSRNLYEEGNKNPGVAWLSQEHYNVAGGTAWPTDSNNYGPLTALKALKERTATWTNLEEYSYELNFGVADAYDGKGTYSGEYVQNVTARLPRLSDVIGGEIGCRERGNTCPSWVYDGIIGYGDDHANGYWFSDASSASADASWYMYKNTYVYDSTKVYKTYYGVRPVIYLSKPTIQ